MRAKLSGEEALVARDLQSQGRTLEQIRQEMHRPDISLMCLSRALRNVEASFQRIEAARRTGNLAGLTCAEAVVALMPTPPAPKGEVNASSSGQ